MRDYSALVFAGSRNKSRLPGEKTTAFRRHGWMTPFESQTVIRPLLLLIFVCSILFKSMLNLPRGVIYTRMKLIQIVRTS